MYCAWISIVQRPFSLEIPGVNSILLAFRRLRSVFAENLLHKQRHIDPGCGSKIVPHTADNAAFFLFHPKLKNIIYILLFIRVLFQHVVMRTVELERKLGDSRIVALGEAGLDRAHSATLPRQREVFERQVALSERFGLPLIVHNVRCSNELLAFRNRLKPTQRWIVHGFAGGLDEARQLINHGFLLSVGAALFDDRRKIVNALPEIGLENLFFETDTSDVSIIKVYEKAAELLGLTVSALREDVWNRVIPLHPLQ